MANRPSKVSIIVPLFNRAGLIGETLASVCGQSYQDLEILVVDDGSTDGSTSIVEEWQRRDSRVHLVFRSEPPKGAPSCRNLGLRLSTGEFIIFLDSDDLLAQDCVRNRVDLFVANPHCDVVVSQGLLFKDAPGDGRLMWNRADIGTGDIVARFFDQDVPWQTSGPAWRRSALNAIGPWNEQLSSFQDWELHLRACLTGLSLKFTEEPDFYIRRSDSDRISINHFARHHLLSRLAALESIYEIVKKDSVLLKRYRRNFKGFLLRNHLQLVDGGYKDLFRTIPENSAAKELLNRVDRWLLNWIGRIGPKWHWHSRVQRVAPRWWKNVPYNNNAPTSFMTTQWSGKMPAVAGVEDHR